MSMQIGRYTLTLNNDRTYTIQWRDGKYHNTLIDKMSVDDIQYHIDMALLPKWAPIYECADLFHEMVVDPEKFAETEKGLALLGAPGDIPPYSQHQTAEENFQWALKLILRDFNALNNCNIQLRDLEKLCIRDFQHFANKHYSIK